MFHKHRLEALSDGIFAIAMTLLILDIKVPTEVTPGHLGAALLHERGATWFSFGLSFGLASFFWTLQHQVFEYVEEVGVETLIPTFFVLLLVSVLPFSTSMLGHHIREPLAFSIYFGNQFLVAAALTAKMELARKRHHLRPGSQRLRFRLYGISVVMASAGIAALLLPVNYIFIVPMVLGLASRKLRARFLPKLGPPAIAA